MKTLIALLFVVTSYAQVENPTEYPKTQVSKTSAVKMKFSKVETFEGDFYKFHTPRVYLNGHYRQITRPEDSEVELNKKLICEMALNAHNVGFESVEYVYGVETSECMPFDRDNVYFNDNGKLQQDKRWPNQCDNYLKEVSCKAIFQATSQPTKMMRKR